MTDDYDGAIGAFPYAFRHSKSWLFRCYVFVGALATGIVSLFVALGPVALVDTTIGVPGGSLTLSRSSCVLAGLFVIASPVVPTLFVVHRHRRTGSKPRYNLNLALMGFVSILSVYMGLLASVPTRFQTPAEPFAADPVTVLALVPIVRLLCSPPMLYGLVPSAVCAVDIYGIHRPLR